MPPETAAIRVLVADDDPLVRSFLAKYVATWGYHAAEAEDGGEALSVLESSDRPRLR